MPQRRTQPLVHHDVYLNKTNRKGKQMSNQEKTKSIHVNEFPVKLWQVFAANCRLKGITIREGLERVIRNYLENE